MHFEYCPHCGTKTILKEIGDEGEIPYCPKCQVPLWDMFCTSVIVAVINEFEEIALIRQDYVSATKFVCVAGIIKIGEEAEECAKREVQEEIGQTVENLRFVKSYAYDKKQMLMLGFEANVHKKDFALSCEVNSAEWVPLKNALGFLREGGIAWQLVKSIIEKRASAN